MSSIAVVMLYVCVSGSKAGTPNWHCVRTEHPSYASCFKALREIRVIAQPSEGNTVVAYCGTKATQERWDDGKWYAGTDGDGH